CRLTAFKQSEVSARNQKRSPFRLWFAALNPTTQTDVLQFTNYRRTVEMGHLSSSDVSKVPLLACVPFAIDTLLSAACQCAWYCCGCWTTETKSHIAQSPLQVRPLRSCIFSSVAHQILQAVDAHSCQRRLWWRSIAKRVSLLQLLASSLL